METQNLKFPWVIRTALDQKSKTKGLFIENNDGEFVCDFYVKCGDDSLYPFPNAEANAAAIVAATKRMKLFEKLKAHSRKVSQAIAACIPGAGSEHFVEAGGEHYVSPAAINDIVRPELKAARAAKIAAHKSKNQNQTAKGYDHV